MCKKFAKEAKADRPQIMRQNRVLQELASIVNIPKRQTILPETNTLIFTTEGSAKLWHKKSVKKTNQRKCLLGRRCDWEFSADLSQWDSHPSIIKETKLRPDIMICSTFSKQLIIVELTIPYKNRMKERYN